MATRAREAVLAAPEELLELSRGAREAERQAVQAALLVAAFVGVPALAAAGAVLVMFALTSLVLLAPLVAAALVWVAWRANRPPRRGPPQAA